MSIRFFSTKMIFRFSIRTILFCKELFLFIKKGLRKSQKSLFKTLTFSVIFLKVFCYAFFHRERHFQLTIHDRVYFLSKHFVDKGGMITPPGFPFLKRHIFLFNPIKCFQNVRITFSVAFTGKKKI